MYQMRWGVVSDAFVVLWYYNVKILWTELTIYNIRYSKQSCITVNEPKCSTLANAALKYVMFMWIVPTDGQTVSRQQEERNLKKNRKVVLDETQMAIIERLLPKPLSKRASLPSSDKLPLMAVKPAYRTATFPYQTLWRSVNRGSTPPAETLVLLCIEQFLTNIIIVFCLTIKERDFTCQCHCLCYGCETA